MSLDPTPENIAIEDRLFGAMDRFALRLIETLEKNGGTSADQVKIQMDAFRMGADWLAKRKRVQPKEGEIGEGVALMRRLLQDPETMFKVMEEGGFARLPPKKAGRPTKAEAAQRGHHKAAVRHTQEARKSRAKPDDIKLREMLNNPPTGEMQ